MAGCDASTPRPPSFRIPAVAGFGDIRTHVRPIVSDGLACSADSRSCECPPIQTTRSTRASRRSRDQTCTREARRPWIQAYRGRGHPLPKKPHELDARASRAVRRGASEIGPRSEGDRSRCPARRLTRSPVSRGVRTLRKGPIRARMRRVGSGMRTLPREERHDERGVLRSARRLAGSP